MSGKTSKSADVLAAEMRGYEAATRMVLPRHSYTVVRVDGRSFSGYTRRLVKPFDPTFATDMDAVAAELAREVSGSVAAYVQSDEVSVLVTDLGGERTEPWFGGVVPKFVSLTASLATAVFAERRPGSGRALFDSRVFTLPDAPAVERYFLYRQRDAVRNSVAMAAQANFSHRELQGVGVGRMKEMLRAAGKPWESEPDGFRFGRLVEKESRPGEVTFTHGRSGREETVSVVRTVWAAKPAPDFSAAGTDFLARLLPPRV